MKTKNIFKILIGLMVAAGTFTSCVDDNSDFATPQIVCEEPDVTVTNTLEELNANAVGAIHQLTEDIVVEGYVVSSDEQGNFFSSISIQNLEGTAGVRLSVDQRDIYTRLDIGQKVYLKAQHLFIDNDGGDADIALGALFGSFIGRLPDVEVNNFIFRSCDEVPESSLVHPATLATFNDDQLNTLIEFSNVQFSSSDVGGNYFDPNNTAGSATNRIIVDEDGNELIVRNSEFADFANEALPSGNGKIRGVLSKFRGDYQLFIRDTNDVQFTGERQLWGFADNVSGSLVTIASLRDAFNTGTFNITDDSVIEGIITMSTQNGNLTSRNAFIQDASGAIVVRFDSDAHGLFEGYKVRINVKDLSLGTFAGLLQVSNVDQDVDVQVLDINGTLPTPLSITIDDLFTDNFQGQLVSINDVQFTQTLVAYGGGRSLTNCEVSFPIFTSGFATFADAIVPSGKGTVIGIASTFNGPQLLLRSSEDTAGLTGERCAQPEAFYTEDFESLSPTGNGNAINLTGWSDVDENANSELWEARSFGGNSYAQASAFNISNPMKVWLITPAIDLSGVTEPSFTFGYTQNFYNGETLKVFISTDYDGSSTSPQNFTWTDITTLASATDNNPSGFMNSFSTSNSIDLSSFSGQIYVAFLYEGDGGGITTNVQIDNLQFFGK